MVQTRDQKEDGDSFQHVRDISIMVKTDRVDENMAQGEQSNQKLVDI